MLLFSLSFARSNHYHDHYFLYSMLFRTEGNKISDKQTANHKTLLETIHGLTESKVLLRVFDTMLCVVII